MNVLLALAALAVLASLFFGRSDRTPPAGELARPAPPLLPPTAELPGGDPTQPIAVPSPAVIDNHAERWPCPVCASSVRCEHHRVEHLAARRLRVARVRCPRCAFERDVYFELEADAPN